MPGVQCQASSARCPVPGAGAAIWPAPVATPEMLPPPVTSQPLSPQLDTVKLAALPPAYSVHLLPTTSQTAGPSSAARAKTVIWERERLGPSMAQYSYYTVQSRATSCLAVCLALALLLGLLALAANKQALLSLSLLVKVLLQFKLF